MEKANDGDGLLSAILNDPELKENFTALVANLRENGVLRYKDTAGAEGEASADLGEDEEAPRPFFRKR